MGGGAIARRFGLGALVSLILAMAWSISNAQTLIPADIGQRLQAARSRKVKFTGSRRFKRPLVLAMLRSYASIRKTHSATSIQRSAPRLLPKLPVSLVLRQRSLRARLNSPQLHETLSSTLRRRRSRVMSSKDGGTSRFSVSPRASRQRRSSEVLGPRLRVFPELRQPMWAQPRPLHRRSSPPRSTTQWRLSAGRKRSTTRLNRLIARFSPSTTSSTRSRCATCRSALQLRHPQCGPRRGKARGAKSQLAGHICQRSSPIGPGRSRSHDRLLSDQFNGRNLRAIRRRPAHRPRGTSRRFRADHVQLRTGTGSVCHLANPRSQHHARCHR